MFFGRLSPPVDATMATREFDLHWWFGAWVIDRGPEVEVERAGLLGALDPAS
jgi:hypothetical protein